VNTHCGRGHKFSRWRAYADGYQRGVCHKCQAMHARVKRNKIAPKKITHVPDRRIAELAEILANQYFLPRAIPLRLATMRGV
jgi:hypothetical protein